MKILEVNENDIYGRVFNGYDIAEYYNKNTQHEVKQIVVNKYSDNKNVETFFKNKVGNEFERAINAAEQEHLSAHSILTLTSDFLESNSYYKNADLVHYHQVHNAHLNLTKFGEMCQTKPTVMSFHDPWPMTGRCVHPGKCEKWKTGCKNCEHLDTLFAFSTDNCNSLWNLKKDVFQNSDIDVIVSTKFMLDILKQNPYTKNLNVHVLPFGLDLKKFEFKKTKEQIRKKFGIPKDSLVLFFREQQSLKGTNYIVDALKNINVNQNITLLTCSETGLLTEIKDKFQTIELGVIEEKKILECYNACDIFLMPSLGESFGMMAIEAMASGKPVVVFNNTALPSVTFAPECGVLVNDRDSDDLREKILYLINNPKEREKRGKLGKELVKEHYNIETYYKKLEKIYESAYNRQKYKLKKEKTTSLEFDKEDPEVKKLLLKLEKVAKRVIPSESNLKTLSSIDYLVKETKKIDYSNKNVQKAVVAFNNEIFKKIKAIDDQFYANSRKGFRKTKIYQLLKKSKFLKKVYNKIRYIFSDKNFERYNNLMYAIQKVEIANQELTKKIEILNERIDKLNEK